MRNIICIGDSHTWGQGAGDFWDRMNPPLQPGEYRQMSYDPPYYVNLLRKYVNENSGSYCGEIIKDRAEGIKITGSIYGTPFISIANGSIKATIRCSMFRLQMKCGREGTKASITVDKMYLAEIYTYDENENSNNYRIWKFCGLPDGEHELIIETLGNGRLDLYRIDYYGGKYAVINSGIGSCDSGHFLKTYWDSYVDNFKPYLVVIEGFSINDWIRNTPIDKYMEYLDIMFGRVSMIGGRCILLTVSPIIGKQQYFPGGPDYMEYVEASIKAAHNANIPVADAYKAIKNIIRENTSEEDLKNLLFKDNWHINNTGHRIYFECIRQIFEEYHLL